MESIEDPPPDKDRRASSLVAAALGMTTKSFVPNHGALLMLRLRSLQGGVFLT